MQTKKLQPYLIILMRRSYWDGLLKWLTEEAIGRDRLDPSGLHLYTVTDDVEGSSALSSGFIMTVNHRSGRAVRGKAKPSGRDDEM
jgi:predicted Rossmann-fold nucleotide-binding protein